MTALIEVPQDSPRKSDFFEQGPVDSCEPAGGWINYQKPLHPNQNLLCVSGRLVSGVRAKPQTHQLPPRIATGLSAFFSVVLVQESIGQGFHDAQGALAIFLLLRMFAAEFFSVASQALQATFLGLDILRCHRSVVRGDCHAYHGVARLHIKLGLRTLRSLLACAEHMFRRIAIGGYFVRKCTPNQFRARSWIVRGWEADP